jgi:uncharacterized phiE125 gp8 family phage protein
MQGEFRSSALSVVTPAAGLPVSLDAARRNSRIDTTDEDTRLTELIGAATKYVQRHTDTALITQTLSWKMDLFPRNKKPPHSATRPLYLPTWPVQSLVSVSYVDMDGNTQTIPTNTIALRSPAFGHSRIARQNWEAWPSVKATPDAVDIRFIAGFGATHASVPDEFQQAILLLVSHWFENREAALGGSMSKEIEFSVSALIETIRDTDGWGFDLE